MEWIVALLAGVASFVSPCMWPMYPAYLTYLAGVPAGGPAPGRRLLLGRAALFLLGFAVVFIAAGAGASAVGQALAAYQLAFRRVAGLLIVGFGLAMAGALPYWVLGTDRRLHFRPVRPSAGGAVALGAAFAFGWTPCIGPVLASILLLTSVSAHLGRGMALLAAYTVGFALPFLAVAAALPQARGVVRRFAPAVGWASRLAGGLLVLLGVLVFTGGMSAITLALYARLRG